MELNFDAACRAALDLAKRTIPEGSELDAGCLMESIYFTTNLKERFPQLSPYLQPPRTLRDGVPSKVPVAESLQPVLRSLAECGRPVTPDLFLLSLLRTETGRQGLVSRGMAEREIAAFISTLEAQLDRSAPTPPAETSGWRSSPQRQEAISALSSFGRMLTGTVPPYKGVVELESALRSIVRTLSKMGRKNAIITGYPGTGKTALVYEFARRLMQGHESIPAGLRDRDIFELSPSFLRSGASMAGQYDERIKSLIETLRRYPKIILFVDEIHSLFRSGIHEKGPFSEANESFKSVLGRGEITCIGCATTADYRHYLEPDKAFARRFTEIRIEPPSSQATVRILKARRPLLEEYFAQLRIPDQVLEKAAELTEDYLPGRYQPDKSIQLLDEACAYCVTAQPRIHQVTEEELWQALEDLIGHSPVRVERLQEANVFREVSERIIGQEEAIRGITHAFIAGMGGWAKGSGPRGVFFFGGPTGVGKTETAIALSKILGGGREALVRVDCNTLQGSGHDSGPAMNRLLGPPPGYLGYARGQGGILSRIRDMPECIVLFDEIEKADPGVGKLLLQILDDGRVEDVDGNVLDFRRSFIIFTTNAGCIYDRKRIGFEEAAPVHDSAPHVDLDALKGELRAIGYGEEFLGRINHFFVFQSLAADSVRAIIQTQLASLGQAAEVRGYELEWDPEIVAYLTSQWQPRFGVRHLTTVLRNRISEQLSMAEAQGELRGIRKILLRVMPLDDVSKSRILTGLALRERAGDTLLIHLA
jgi:ATP-dependent Clp protease ATP-binding subunit ClpA